MPGHNMIMQFLILSYLYFKVNVFLKVHWESARKVTHASFRPFFCAFSCKKSVKYPDIRRFFAEFARKTESKICIPDFPSALLAFLLLIKRYY